VIGDEVVVHRVADRASFVLNSTAGILWRCLDGDSRLGEIVDDLADGFAADRSTVEQDCVVVVGEWLAQHLVEEVDGG
jgi:hypothetical protein